MKKYRNKTPEEVMKMVTTELIERAIQSGTKKNRSIFISKTSAGKGIDVQSLNPKQAKGK
jgi:NMD protein affecting ribosome stability and mRNA decay